jgi:head-tail adaptor
MRAGELRERITIQKPITSRDPATKQNVVTWVDTSIKRQPAKIVQQSAGETNSSNQVVATFGYLVSMRRRNASGVDETMRIVWHGRDNSQSILNITGIGFDPIHRELQINCRA